MPPQTEKSYSRSRVTKTAAYMQALKSLMPLPPSYLRMLEFPHFVNSCYRVANTVPQGPQ
jgi:hypothetical protein